jgi:integrase
LRHCESNVTKNADLLRFYLRFLALTGAREKEALSIRWADVDFENRFVIVGADADTKNARHRSVNFTSELQSLLRDMSASRPPDNSFLFPSPQRGVRDIPAQSLRESFKLVRSEAGMTHVGFHDLRHFFASTCELVMRALDRYEANHKNGGGLTGLSTGIAPLDKATRRFEAR